MAAVIIGSVNALLAPLHHEDLRHALTRIETEAINVGWAAVQGRSTRSRTAGTTTTFVQRQEEADPGPAADASVADAVDGMQGVTLTSPTKNRAAPASHDPNGSPSKGSATAKESSPQQTAAVKDASSQETGVARKTRSQQSSSGKQATAGGAVTGNQLSTPQSTPKKQATPGGAVTVKPPSTPQSTHKKQAKKAKDPKPKQPASKKGKGRPKKLPEDATDEQRQANGIVTQDQARKFADERWQKGDLLAPTETLTAQAALQIIADACAQLRTTADQTKGIIDFVARFFAIRTLVSMNGFLLQYNTTRTIMRKRLSDKRQNEASGRIDEGAPEVQRMGLALYMGLVDAYFEVAQATQQKDRQDLMVMSAFVTFYDRYSEYVEAASVEGSELNANIQQFGTQVAKWLDPNSSGICSVREHLVNFVLFILTRYAGQSTDASRYLSGLRAYLNQGRSLSHLGRIFGFGSHLMLLNSNWATFLQRTSPVHVIHVFDTLVKSDVQFALLPTHLSAHIYNAISGGTKISKPFRFQQYPTFDDARAAGALTMRDMLNPSLDPVALIAAEDAPTEPTQMILQPPQDDAIAPDTETNDEDEEMDVDEQFIDIDAVLTNEDEVMYG